MSAGSQRVERRKSGGHRVPGEDKPVAHIDRERCDGAPGCPVSRICPRQAVVPDRAAAPAETSWLRGLLAPKEATTTWTVDEGRCTGCLLCAQYCPHRAVVPAERRKTA
ncbi:MAG: 4Fe-4S dicluster domain-containing protein [Thermoleophilia bacterium]